MHAANYIVYNGAAELPVKCFGKVIAAEFGKIIAAESHLKLNLCIFRNTISVFPYIKQL